MTEYRTVYGTLDLEITIGVNTDLPHSGQVDDIVDSELPAALQRFIRKNVDYGDAAVHLGSKGQFADMNRKYWKLKAALWDGKKLTGEPIEEVLQDMIGHCLLTLHFLNRGE